MHMPKETFFRLRDEKQEGILRSAIHEFNLHGFERAKISDIAKGGGASTGSMYQYFEDKNELFMYCAQWSFDLFMKKLNMRETVKDMDIYEYFNDSLRKNRVVSEEAEVVKFMQVLSTQPGMMKESLTEMYEKSEEYIKTLIQNSKDRGLVRTDLDNDVLTDFFIAVTERFKVRWLKQQIDFSDLEAENIKKEVNQMLELIKFGMSEREELT
jgi:AcrR family transcriptional regulator